MLDRYRGQTFSGDRLAILGRLPRLSLQEERSMIKICYRGTLFDLVDGPKEILQLGSFPNIELTGMPHTDKSTIALSIDEREETIYTLQHSMPAIQKAEKEIAQGKFITLEEVKKRFKRYAS